ncbi:MAG: hypothetical protein DMG21_01880 [Acidobacteria bacterium]|nr:MAG: hypothetical protein DMG21_01880 [Acidobacteriota bacterium]
MNYTYEGRPAEPHRARRLAHFSGARGLSAIPPLVSNAFRSSRTRFRNKTFCFRNRPNLALSPFRSDMAHSSVAPDIDCEPWLDFTSGITKTRSHKSTFLVVI